MTSQVEESYKEQLSNLQKELSSIDSYINVMTTKKNSILEDINKVNTDLKDIQNENKWTEFIEGKRKGYLFFDPWDADECSFVKFISENQILVRITYNNNEIIITKIGKNEYNTPSTGGYYVFTI